MQNEIAKCKRRLLADLDWASVNKHDKALFEYRFEQHFPTLFNLLLSIYGQQYDFYYHLKQLCQTLIKGTQNRSKQLKQKDGKRLADPQWYKHSDMIGMACYVDLFAGNLNHLIQRIPYLKKLGITYLHLMPLYDSPKGDSDGGYAVSNYRKVHPNLGKMSDLEVLAEELQKHGISLVLDFVFNHTSDEHAWAMAAKAGEHEYQDYYYMFDDKRLPDQYEQNLREIFPQVRRGNFTFDQTLNKWVWTTFNSFQWDLNYSNPEVFTAIVGEMLFLANIGCDVLRLDALAFIWKELGTNCENQDNAHVLIKAFNVCLQIAAPAVVFKSEAIVHPDEVNKYIAKDECQLSYNPLLMALIWNSLATRKTRLLTHSLDKSFTISDECSWVNYVRCHDDIGWTFDDAVAWDLGINPQDHRGFLNHFFTDRFEGSFASGVAFAENPSNGDCRVCGSLASLCGIEKALQSNNPVMLELAIKRVLLVHAIILSIGGIPLLYSGDELGLLNDYSYQSDPAKCHDDRWVQRLKISDQDITNLPSEESYHSIIFNRLAEMIAIRKQYGIFGDGSTDILTLNNQHCFAFTRELSKLNQQSPKLVVVANFSEEQQTIALPNSIELAEDLLSNLPETNFQTSFTLEPYQVRWLISSV